MSNLSILSGKTYFIRTFGCQMNLHDSERVSGLLDSCGCLVASSPADADIVIFMTCCVREAADTRLYGQCSSCKSLPAFLQTVILQFWTRKERLSDTPVLYGR